MPLHFCPRIKWSQDFVSEAKRRHCLTSLREPSTIPQNHFSEALICIWWHHFLFWYTHPKWLDLTLFAWTLGFLGRSYLHFTSQVLRVFWWEYKLLGQENGLITPTWVVEDFWEAITMLLALGLFFFASLSVLQANSLEVANEDEKEAAAVVTKNRNLLVAEDLLPSELLKHSLKRRSPSAYGGSLRLRRSPNPSPYVPRSWLRRGRGRSSSYSCSTCGGEVIIVQSHIELEKSSRRQQS